jgi:hypothetical protein
MAVMKDTSLKSSASPTLCNDGLVVNASQIKHLDWHDKPAATQKVGRQQRELVLVLKLLLDQSKRAVEVESVLLPIRTNNIVNFKLFIVELRFANGAAAASFGLLIGHRAASEPFARRREKGHSN